MEIIIGVILSLAMICVIGLRSLRRDNYVSEITGVLLNSFSEREKIQEFRIHESKARTKFREFEVKTIRQTYYIVKMKGRKILSKSPIGAFNVSKSDSLVTGILDPISLDRYEPKVKLTDEKWKRG